MFLEVIETQNKDKNDSITMYGKLLNQTFLVTGKIEEKFLTSHYPKIQADVVISHLQASKKKTDIEIFKNVHPKITVISVDKKKSFKDKNAENNQEDKELENLVLKTDQKGAIRFKGWTTWNVETVQ